MVKKILLVFFLFTLVVAPFTTVLGAESEEYDKLLFFIEPIVDGSKVQFELIVRNEGEAPIHLEFSNAQLYEIIVADKEGNQVYQFSQEKGFAQMIQHIRLKPGEDKTWIETWENHALPKGSYQVAAELVAKKINGKPFKGLKDSTMMKVPMHNPMFKDITVQGEKGDYYVKGLTRTVEGKFYYTVEDGHNQQVTETKMKINKSEKQWKDFAINLSIPTEKLPRNGSLILHLYERKGMEIINSYPVVLEDFYEKDTQRGK
ncbi:BsuPI-related putative proteinase inhibitor [Mesobacillus maritimus]|uniref:BsuPI-related putative proteinase inhibitor n=1 Tax=Mesobacillus maritimus TaxID=1643336 RepID=UPI002041E96F|nr:BsuPI-related putative proteinase inhibitor [Mesobacillus maritimus]MCM3667441.1 BsuPI-related putative proteinase inhibitor [Mesobacillus maritimus]